ncbi:hypothetical protein CDAR_128451 [Caerostris darwini]|uniref:Ribosomal protein S10 n=1 Tax=Caerostris darwini TaxID=1538125 RepID=A0AAV4PGK8_9ARAC|nr:hypothetical protein CDAR_128451 [Caerostris darwini]
MPNLLVSPLHLTRKKASYSNKLKQMAQMLEQRTIQNRVRSSFSFSVLEHAEDLPQSRNPWQRISVSLFRNSSPDDNSVTKNGGRGGALKNIQLFVMNFNLQETSIFSATSSCAFKTARSPVFIHLHKEKPEYESSFLTPSCLWSGEKLLAEVVARIT